ncbi:MAG: hypothetical protein IIC62_06825, partial [Proteobacteria bacterium]|nr:hypothetical protein [Pseudomonadota bacterium]
MFQILGAITGSALAIAALLLLVGIPQFKAESSDISHDVVTLPLRVAPVEELAAETLPVVEDIAVVAADVSQDGVIDTEIVEPLADVAALLPDTQQWYAFWSPFRSEIAAAGFIIQLQRVTGLDYRVVKIKPANYEVAFSYAQDGDISINLSQISAATGL